jgi:hypothetical protein
MQTTRPVTNGLCEEAGMLTSTKIGEAVASSGLSRHDWLNPVEPCPGTPLLKQLDQIVGL